MSMLPWSSNPNNPYQVTEDDQDFLTLAANLNVNYDQLKAANPSVQSLSQGQFINVPIAPNPQINAMGAPTSSFLGGGGQTALGVARPLSGSFISGGGAVNQNTVGQPAPIPVPQSVNFQVRNNVSTPQTNTGTFAPGMSAETLASMTQSTIAQYNATGFIDPNLPPAVFRQLLLAGADPVAIQQAKLNSQVQSAPQEQGALINPTTGQTYGTGDAQAGTPGHYYVDANTAKLVGQTITLADGKKRILAADKNGRLYYIKPQGRRRRPPAAVAAQEEVRADAPSTVLNVVLGG